jgi:hypothetical protein
MHSLSQQKSRLLFQRGPLDDLLPSLLDLHSRASKRSSPRTRLLVISSGETYADLNVSFEKRFEADRRGR